MEYTYLNNINSPQDLKRLKVECLPAVCDEVRDFIIRSLSKNPGHLGSSLGVVELTVALHYVFDTPDDLLVWDVGHQAYAHKILTGRRDRFSTNRQLGGLAPFPSPKESVYDAFTAGHASNSISAALGMSVAAEGKRRVVAVIGDGAMTGGLAFEGLNNVSMTKSNLLIVLNDNNMAIDPIKGGMTQYLVDITTSERYNRWRYKTYLWLRKIGLMSDTRKETVQRFNNNLKAVLTKQQRNIFSGLNIRYFGPANGHDVVTLVKIFSEIKDYQGPKVLHVITKKGKGYAPAEKDQTTWHAPGVFDPDTGERMTGERQTPLWQDVFGQTLLELAREDKRIVGVTPAMPTGCSMNIMQHELPDRVFDVGIAEGHAVTFSGGLAKEGKVPVCNIYSSFLQRSFDNIVHDVALPNLHVVLCIDRAGIVGQDGATHHGLLDLTMLIPVPNMTVLAPLDGAELQRMLRWATLSAQGPVAIRYPRGCTPKQSVARNVADDDIFHARLVKEGKQTAVLCFGAIGNAVLEAAENTDVAVYDMRAVKPLDTQTLDMVMTAFDKVFTAEDGMIEGGAGSAVLGYLVEHGYKGAVKRIGINNRFVEHGKPDELYHLLGLDAEGIKRVLTTETEL
ncbi:MAG: 1-deoxy-D-xylulose-5-phosphate synthase [Paludibacteraceae bacterium]|nr:1-deoxy-D-xylulose-5-phosphate synthase [Paludibacteraceae bacterium]